MLHAVGVLVDACDNAPDCGDRALTNCSTALRIHAAANHPTPGQLPAGQGRTLSAPADAPAAPIDAPTTADAHIATGGNSSISRSGTKHPVPKEGPMMATNRKDTKAAADTSSNRSGSSGQAAPGATIFTTTSTTTGGVTAAVVAAAQSVLQATRAGKSQAELEEGLGGAPADSKAGSRDTVAAAGVGAAAAGNKGSSSSTASSSTNARKALSNNTSSSREVQSGAEAVASKADDSTAPPSEAATAAVSAPVAGGSTATSQTGTDAKEGGRYTSSSSSGGGNEELPLVDTEQPDVAPAGRVSQPLAQQDAAAESGQTGGSSDNRQAKEVPQVEIEQLAKGTAGRQQPQTPAATTADNALPPSTAAVDTLVQQQQQQQPEVSRPPPTGTSSTKAAQQQTAARIAAAASQDDTTSDIPSIQPAVAASTQPAAASSGVCTAQATARHSALSPHTLKPQDDTDQAPAASTTAAAEAAAAMQPAAPQGGSRTTVSPPPHSRTRTPTAPPAPPAYDTEVAAEAAASIAAIAAASSSLKPFPPELLPAVGTCPGLTPANMQVRGNLHWWPAHVCTGATATFMPPSTFFRDSFFFAARWPIWGNCSKKHSLAKRACVLLLLLQVLTVWYNKFCCDTEAQQRLALYGHCQPGMLFEDNFIKVGVGGAACLCV